MKHDLCNKDNIYIGDSVGKGKTYFAKKDFKKGDVVYCFQGPIVTVPSDYTCPIDIDLYIDPYEYGGKYTNDYGLDANLGIKNRTTLVAMRDIQKDEEVGPAYFMFVPYYITDSTADTLGLSCFGTISEELKMQYKEYISDFLFL